MSCLCFVLDCYFIWDDYCFKQTAVSTTGVITHINVEYDGDTSHTVFVAFTLNGHNKYTGWLNYYISGMYADKAIEIWDNPDNPAAFKGNGGVR